MNNVNLFEVIFSCNCIKWIQIFQIKLEKQPYNFHRLFLSN